MAALAEFPDRIANVFSEQWYPSDGLFQFKFYAAGKQHKVTIDDRLPVMISGDDVKPINIRKSPNGAWWGPILEKGAAKFFSRYENMNGGVPTESLYALTGMPTLTVTNKNVGEEELWKILSDFDQRNYVMTASVKDEGDGRDKQGLVNNHAYTLKGVKDFNGTRLVQIRNPWGSEKY